MKIFITIFFILFCILYFTLGISQNAYIAKDSAYTFGVEIIEGKDYLNSVICKVKQWGKEIEYTPDQLSEYQTESGRIYISKELEINGSSKKYFLEKLVVGDINLYYMKIKKEKIFIIEKDSSIFELLQKNDSSSREYSYRIKLKELYLDTNAVKLSRYQKNNLKLLTERQNSNNYKPFPFIKLGVLIGLSASKIFSPVDVSSVYAEDMNSKFDLSFIPGVFFDIPIFLGYTSFHPEILYIQNSFSETIEKDSTVYDILLKYSSLNLPLLIRYTYPSFRIRPYTELGILYSYHQYRTQEIYRSIFCNDIVYLEKMNSDDIISKNMLGFTGGIGVQYNFNYRKSLYFEFRYGKQFGISDFNTASKSTYLLMTSFNF